MPRLLEVNKLCAWYGATQVLHDVDFTLEAGHITAILGANGAGKTTTLRALCQGVKTRGSIVLNGRQLVGKSTESVVRLGGYVRGNKAELEQDMQRMFTRFPILQARRTQQAGTLSGGEQQMLAISRALMLRPTLLLLDEPSFGVAPLVVAEIFAILRTINQEDGASMLLVEQNANLALDLADHAYLLETGRVALSGPAADIKRDEKVRQTYLGY